MCVCRAISSVPKALYIFQIRLAREEVYTTRIIWRKCDAFTMIIILCCDSSQNPFVSPPENHKKCLDIESSPYIVPCHTHTPLAPAPFECAHKEVSRILRVIRGIYAVDKHKQFIVYWTCKANWHVVRTWVWSLFVVVICFHILGVWQTRLTHANQIVVTRDPQRIYSGMFQTLPNHWCIIGVHKTVRGLN